MSSAAVLSFQPGSLDVRRLSATLHQKDRAVAAIKKYMATGV